MKRLNVTSRQNPTIKQLLQWHKSARAARDGVFIAEGGRLVGRALAAGYAPRLVLSSDKLHGPEERAATASLARHGEAIDSWLEAPRFLYDHVSYRDGGSGLLVVFERREHALATLPVEADGLYLVLESPEKPGNIGAVCRSADAAGATGLIVCERRTDLYNPNCLTASTGAVFSLPVAITDAAELSAWLTANGVRLLAAICDEGSTGYLETDFSGAVAIAIGREHEGLDESLTAAADAKVHIPMRGQVDSLNASSAAAILLFHAQSHRRGK